MYDEDLSLSVSLLFVAILDELRRSSITQTHLHGHAALVPEEEEDKSTVFSIPVIKKDNNPPPPPPPPLPPLFRSIKAPPLLRGNMWKRAAVEEKYRRQLQRLLDQT
ncbi:hypothetical protein EYF80_026650 [Liparis tanakae]|uniref:Uncharacterized protein n=1 Tax=Liparis tanakae TaxID=230148 RepID=A0A4Z2HBP6_9TELE|nr:hypothetical protein EYF80_026650 [Liparis tanakae]